MNIKLLTSEKFVKSVTAIDDNVASKYIVSAIHEAQEIRLKRIIGKTMLDKLKDVVTQTRATANEKYFKMIDECQMLLAYESVCHLCDKVNFKITNMGVVQTSDSNANPVRVEDMERVRNIYQAKADASAYELQLWILDNRSDYPEIDSLSRRRIQSNLYSSATCGLWLGGARGK